MLFFTRSFTAVDSLLLIELYIREPGMETASRLHFWSSSFLSSSPARHCGDTVDCRRLCHTSISFAIQEPQGRPPSHSRAPLPALTLPAHQTLIFLADTDNRRSALQPYGLSLKRQDIISRLETRKNKWAGPPPGFLLVADTCQLSSYP